MASEDVLERAEALLRKCVGYELPEFTDSLIVEDLAAEVRELRAKLAEPWRHFSCPETSEPCDRMCLTMCHRRSVELSDLRDQVQTMLAGRMSASASEAAMAEESEGEAMAKLYWADSKDSESWCGPHADIDECKRVARVVRGEDGGEIWVAPADAAFDDDDQFWAAFAQTLFWDLDRLEERLVEEGWADPEEAWLSEWNAEDVDSALANALRKVLPPRPEWRTVDTSKAERVEL